jgi:hypothetical protein
MNFLLLGLDSLIACVAIGALVDRGSRLKLAALFGVADGIAFLVGAALGLRFSEALTGGLETGILVALGLYLLVVAGGTQRVAANWPVWVVPWALTFDNLTYGLVGDHAAGTVLSQATEQALSSALLAVIALVAVAAVLPRIERRPAANRVAGGALLLAAGGLVLLG